MIELEYSGNNTITFGKYKIAKGLNQIEKNDFINFMKLPNFEYRVKNNIFNVKNYLEIIEFVNEENENSISDESNIEKGLVRDILVTIKISHDLEMMYKMLDSDKRPRVQKALYERIEEIN